MIVARAPFRISFAGGGSDLPSFYRQSGGAVVSTTIDKYIYIAIHPYFHNKLRIRYAKTEDVDRVEEIQHPLVRECLKMLGVAKENQGRGMEIASFADVPAGTGMGSSSAFTVCLLHALHGLRSHAISARQLAEQACDIEINRAGEPIGKQDQYASAFGGLNLIRFNKDESVEVEPIECPAGVKAELESQLMLFYIGQERPARSILVEQSQNMTDKQKVTQVANMVELATELRKALEKGNVGGVGEILDKGWELKARLATGISNPVVDGKYRVAKEAGASGGKLLGAGGGGFLLLCCRPEKQAAVRTALRELREMRFKMSEGGSQILHNDETHTANMAAAPAYSHQPK
jgi:D-glycero-alpha-D-manno-heptose-7-phosphate kinase